MALQIITDSTSYIPANLIKKYNIEILSLNILMNGESKRETDWENEKFYIEMKKSGEFPKSAQPYIEEIKNMFEENIKQGNHILGIFMSSKMSGTYSTATMIKQHLIEIYPEARIELIDSRSNSMQLGFAAIEGAKAASMGKSIEEAMKEVNHVINHSRFIFTPENLEYLKKGGRIGGAAALMGHLLKIRPILTVENGETTVLTKARTKKRAVEILIGKFYEDISLNELGAVIVHHINCEEEGKAIAKMIEEKLGIEVDVQPIGPVIGTHVGPGSVAVAYWWKS
ncbi:MAG: DegV family protein [Proteocatella sp.]